MTELKIEAMSDEIRALEPRAVWRNFSNLNAVPRPSKKEERVIEFMLNFGRSLNLETLKDEVGNVIIRKPATAGMENCPMVTLQSHLDMVHQKNSDTTFDFDRQGIAMYRDGDWVRARGTTLGADNGLGVAAIMGLLESEDIPHPPLEALFTIDEETGMTGAMGLKAGVLQGEILLNLDTEDDDEIDIGCAGGIDVTARRTYKEEAIPEGYRFFELSVKGLQGGHSGMDIHKGFGNANKIMNRLLFHSGEEHDVRISRIDGGGLRNAIPRESKALVAVAAEASQAFLAAIESLAETQRQELQFTEGDLEIVASITEAATSKVMDKESQQGLLRALYTAHNGVYAMSASIEGLVETSNNIARVVVNDGEISISCLTRSAVDSAKMDLAASLRSAFELAGFSVEFSGSYTGWKPNPDSKILEVLEETYQNLFQVKPRVVACHAGLECGILGQHYPEMDMISFGPTIKGAHSPDERASITSVRKFWEYLQEILQKIPCS